MTKVGPQSSQPSPDRSQQSDKAQAEQKTQNKATDSRQQPAVTSSAQAASTLRTASAERPNLPSATGLPPKPKAKEAAQVIAEKLENPTDPEQVEHLAQAVSSSEEVRKGNEGFKKLEKLATQAGGFTTQDIPEAKKGMVEGFEGTMEGLRIFSRNGEGPPAHLSQEGKQQLGDATEAFLTVLANSNERFQRDPSEKNHSLIQLESSKALLTLMEKAGSIMAETGKFYSQKQLDQEQVMREHEVEQQQKQNEMSGMDIFSKAMKYVGAVVSIIAGGFMIAAGIGGSLPSFGASLAAGIGGGLTVISGGIAILSGLIQDTGLIDKIAEAHIPDTGNISERDLEQMRNEFKNSFLSGFSIAETTTMIAGMVLSMGAMGYSAFASSAQKTTMAKDALKGAGFTDEAIQAGTYTNKAGQAVNVNAKQAKQILNETARSLVHELGSNISRPELLQAAAQNAARPEYLNAILANMSKGLNATQATKAASGLLLQGGDYAQTLAQLKKATIETALLKSNKVTGNLDNASSQILNKLDKLDIDNISLLERVLAESIDKADDLESIVRMFGENLDEINAAFTQSINTALVKAGDKFDEAFKPPSEALRPDAVTLKKAAIEQINFSDLSLGKTTMDVTNNTRGFMDAKVADFFKNANNFDVGIDNTNLIALNQLTPEEAAPLVAVQRHNNIVAGVANISEGVKGNMIIQQMINTISVPSSVAQAAVTVGSETANIRKAEIQFMIDMIQVDSTKLEAVLEELTFQKDLVLDNADKIIAQVQSTANTLSSIVSSDQRAKGNLFRNTV